MEKLQSQGIKSPWDNTLIPDPPILPTQVLRVPSKSLNHWSLPEESGNENPVNCWNPTTYTQGESAAKPDEESTGRFND
jgi:hypothetical protein